jgi:hypothetical protein
MLFRNQFGQIIEVNKYKFINDKLYYKKIIEIKQQQTMPKLEKTFNNKND